MYTAGIREYKAPAKFRRTAFKIALATFGKDTVRVEVKELPVADVPRTFRVQGYPRPWVTERSNYT